MTGEGAALVDLIRAALAGPFTWRTVMPSQPLPVRGESAVSQAQQGATASQVAALQAAWRQGLSTRQGAAGAGVSQSTASRYYRRFDAG